MKPAISFFLLGTLLVFSPIACCGQLIIDATGPTRQRIREATTGSGRGVGRKMPIQVTTEAVGGWDDGGKIEIDFTLTNTGAEKLTIPTSPNPGDLEPTDLNATYTVVCLTLRVAPRKRPAAILPGGADLCGSPKLTGTLTTLAPGGSLRVLTRTSLPRFTSSENETVAFVASAVLSDETIKVASGQTISDTREIGTATSRDFTIRSIFRVP